MVGILQTESSPQDWVRTLRPVIHVSDLGGGEGLQGVQSLQDALHVLLQSGQSHHHLLVQTGCGRPASPRLPVSVSAALQVAGLRGVGTLARGPGPFNHKTPDLMLFAFIKHLLTNISKTDVFIQKPYMFERSPSEGNSRSTSLQGTNLLFSFCKSFANNLNVTTSPLFNRSSYNWSLLMLDKIDKIAD